jgi:hypothetical protein
MLFHYVIPQKKHNGLLLVIISENVVDVSLDSLQSDVFLHRLPTLF